ncbi:peptidoglycan DD-metalloendopeptidase family protein [Bacillus sp. JJ1562]|uniref:peptidoglycan DD-metalloendopeptidase family protein n=1 Tax=Bacillus sp. JJ1562 TaxID=3122960 RepID=UPI003002549B
MRIIKLFISFVIVLTVFTFGGFSNKASAQFDEETFKTPSNGTLTSGFGPRWGQQHNGIDIAAYLNNPIKAAAKGKVIEVGRNRASDNKKPWFGNYVIISHNFGGSTTYNTVYGHLNSTAVSVGSTVSQGQVIGYEGNTGDVVGPSGIHLHFEIHRNGAAINPAPLTGDWKFISSGWTYKYLDGSLHKGWLKDNGTWYYTDTSSGIMKTGWVLVGTTWYFMNTSGAMQTGWIVDGSHWYYLASNGAMQAGWVQDGSHWYYLTEVSGGAVPKGAMQTGWYFDGSSWYYLNPVSGSIPKGAMYTGWNRIDGKDYYFYNNGVMAKNTTVNGRYLGSDGAATN